MQFSYDGETKIQNVLSKQIYADAKFFISDKCSKHFRVTVYVDNSKNANGEIAYLKNSSAQHLLCIFASRRKARWR